MGFKRLKNYDHPHKAGYELCSQKGRLQELHLEHGTYLLLLTKNIRADRMLRCNTQHSTAKSGVDKSANADGNVHNREGSRWMVHQQSAYRAHKIDQKGRYIWAKCLPLKLFRSVMSSTEITKVIQLN